MKQAMSVCRHGGVVATLGIVSFLYTPAARAQQALPPGTRSHFVAAPVPFEQARANARRAARLRPAVTFQPASVAPPEIVELARALKNDPDLIYQYVHDNIEFTPLWGYLKGPVGTLLDGRGDAFDQSALMIALLDQASLSNPDISNTNFVIGQLSLTNAQLASWLNVDSNANSIGGILGSAGIPGTAIIGFGALVGHVWVSVSIKGTTYVFDPAFKAHTWKTGIVANLPTIMGYSQAQFITDAGVAPQDSTSIKITNRTALRNDLATYAGNLASYIHSNLPTGGVADVVGGGAIVPTPLVNGVTIRQTSNPNQDNSVTPTVTATVPGQYFATLSITLPHSTTQTFDSVDIYGHRLSIFFDSTFTPTMYLDGSPVVTGVPDSEGHQEDIAEEVTIPWFPSASNTVHQFITAESSANSAGYVVATGWGQVGRGMIEKHRALLTQAIQSGEAANSEEVLGETIAMIGYTWLAECAAQQQLADQLLGTATQYFYGGGIAGEATGPGIASPYVDLPLNFINTPARINATGQQQPPSSMAAFLDSSGTSSSFESTTLEQTQGGGVAGFTAASTVKLLDIAVQNGDTIFDINNGNISSQATYNSTIRPMLVPNYDDIGQIDSYVNSGYRVIAPLHGRIPIGSWTGVGFKTMFGNQGGAFSYGEIISGGLAGQAHSLKGGFGGVNDPPLVLVQTTNGAMLVPADLAYLYGGPGGNGTVGDPLDRRKGSLQYANADLRVGAKPSPYGLTFERSYDSGAQSVAGPLGNGWTHKFAITAAAGSDGFSGMGMGSALNAVSSIVALYVSSNLVDGQALTGQANLANFVLEAIVNHWFTDQLTQNVVSVSEGFNTVKFVKMADGTYSAPVGSASALDAPGGNFRFRTKTGVTMNFNPSGQISTWQTAAGASLSFTYSGGLLSSVSNSATGRHLNLTYTGNLISSVSDGTRTVSYAYTGGNLTAFTDALGQKTTYAYDTSGAQDTAGHFTQVFYPSNPTHAFATTYYDSLGKVVQQSDANGNLTQVFFALARSEIDDPVGNLHVYYNDSRGNVLAEIQDYGPSPHLNVTTVNTYDGQDNLLNITWPEGNVYTYTYDALFNPLTFTKTPKPGSALSPVVYRNAYVAPVASLPNFEEIQTSTDPNGKATNFTYNASTGTLATIVQPAVNKPGAGSVSPHLTYTYTAIGLPQTVQDAEGRVTRYDYDATFADEVIKETSDSGGLNLQTQFGYDSFGDITSNTDPNGHKTTNQFDALRRLTEVDRAIAGVVKKYTYYPDGQVKTIACQVSAGTFETTQFAYTLSDKTRTVTDPLGKVTTTTYDADDRKQTFTQPIAGAQTHQRTYSYDALGRLTRISDTTSGSPGTALETHAYTANGQLQSFTDANNHTTGYTYDGLDRLSQTKYPDNGTEGYQYDSTGNVVLKTTRSGQTIQFAYDALNRTSTKTPAGEAGGAVTFGYDLTGRLLQASDASSANPYLIAYDTAGRPISYTDQQGRNTQVQYDAAGNRTRLQWPAGTNGAGAYFVTYSYDTLNRMTEIDANGSPASPLAKYQWDALSRQTSITYGDGTSDSYSRYDADDNLQTLTASFAGGSSVTFGYTWLDNRQRQATTVSNNAFQYAPSAATTNYGAADVDNAYTSVGGANLTYDGNHNLSFDGFNTLTYDVENRLIQAQNGISGTVQYQYDPLGNRKQKLVNGVTTEFVFAGSQEIADFVGVGAGAPQALTVRGVHGRPVAVITPSSGVAVYYHHDGLGSTIALSASGTSGPAEVHAYDEFGVHAGGSTALYRFAGYRYDGETGLYYVRHRYYSAQLGRFLQTDPIGYRGGRNLYAYAQNDPVNLTDSNGTCSSPAGCSLGGLPLLAGTVFTPTGADYNLYGHWFEDQFLNQYGLEEQTFKIETSIGNTVPDLYGEEVAIGELKTSGYLTLEETGQIPAQLAIAEADEIPYLLIVSPETTVSGPLIGATLETGGGVFVYDATAGTLAVAEGAEAGLSVAELLELLALLAL